MFPWCPPCHEVMYPPCPYEMMYLLCPYVMKWCILHVLISLGDMSLCHEVMYPCQHVPSCHRLSLKIEPLPSSPEGKSTVSRAKEGLELIVDSPSRCESPKHCPGGATEVSSLHHRKANSLGARWVRLYTLNHRPRCLYSFIGVHFLARTSMMFFDTF